MTRPENPDVLGTFAKTIAAINAMPQQPAFVAHTGDVTHLSNPAQFDAAKQVLCSLRVPLIVLPGEHDVIGSPWGFFDAFARPDAPEGWFSFDQGGMHFLSLVNAFNLEVDGKLGAHQLDFVEKDLAAQKTSTPSSSSATSRSTRSTRHGAGRRGRLPGARRAAPTISLKPESARHENGSFFVVRARGLRSCGRTTLNTTAKGRRRVALRTA